jgi:hypothetical protein
MELLGEDLWIETSGVCQEIILPHIPGGVSVLLIEVL